MPLHYTKEGSGAQVNLLHYGIETVVILLTSKFD